MTAKDEGAIPHDSRRCPECSSRGTIVDTRTGDNVSGDRAKRVKSRTFECWECDTRWRMYG